MPSHPPPGNGRHGWLRRNRHRFPIGKPKTRWQRVVGAGVFVQRELADLRPSSARFDQLTRARDRLLGMILDMEEDDHAGC